MNNTQIRSRLFGTSKRDAQGGGVTMEQMKLQLDVERSRLGIIEENLTASSVKVKQNVKGLFSTTRDKVKQVGNLIATVKKKIEDDEFWVFASFYFLLSVTFWILIKRLGILRISLFILSFIPFLPPATPANVTDTSGVEL
jgi:hypothetical protein